MKRQGKTYNEKGIFKAAERELRHRKRRKKRERQKARITIIPRTSPTTIKAMHAINDFNYKNLLFPVTWPGHCCHYRRG